MPTRKIDKHYRDWSDIARFWIITGWERICSNFRWLEGYVMMKLKFVSNPEISKLSYKLMFVAHITTWPEIVNLHDHKFSQVSTFFNIVFEVNNDSCERRKPNMFMYFYCCWNNILKLHGKYYSFMTWTEYFNYKIKQ